MKGHGAALQRAGEILDRIKDIENPVVIEVGVNQGKLSRILLDKRKDLKLYMVDSWLGEAHQPAHYKNTRDRNATRTQGQADKAKDQARAIQYKYKERCEIIEMNSVDAALYFEPKSADLVFIDADHSYEGVKGDIEAYLPIAKVWIGGHDYRNPQPQFNFKGVDKAVEEAFGVVETGKNVTWFKRL